MDENSVIGSLPSTRPHRRSAKRAPTPALGHSDNRAPLSVSEPPAEPSQEPLALAVQALAEVATAGISLSAKALRASVARLPRP